MSFYSDSVRLTETRLLWLRHSGILTDLTLRARLRRRDSDVLPFPVHRVVLAGTSPAFFHLLERNALGEEVDVPDSVDAAALDILLDYVYLAPLTLPGLILRLRCDYRHWYGSTSAQLTPDSVADSVDDLIVAADFFGFQELAKVFMRWKPELIRLSVFDDVKLEGLKSEPDPVKEEPEVDEEFGSPGKRSRGSSGSADVIVGSRRAVVCVKRLTTPIQTKVETLDGEDVDDDFDGSGFAMEDGGQERLLSEETVGYERKRRGRRAGGGSQKRRRRKGSPVKRTQRRPRLLSLPSPDPGSSVKLSTVPASPPAFQSSPPTMTMTTTDSNIDDFNGNSAIEPPPSPLIETEQPKEIVSGFAPEDFINLGSDDLKDLFKNPKDLQTIIKKRIQNNVEKVKGDANSWHPAYKHDKSFIGTLIPFGNKSCKIWDKEGKKIIGEMRNTDTKNTVSVTLEDGSMTTVRFKRSNQKLFCPFCAEQLSSNNLHKLADHCLNNHGYVWVDRALVCSLCQYVVISSRRLQEHLQRHHNVDCPTEKLVFPCGNCGRKWRSADGRRKHERVCRSKIAKSIRNGAMRKETNDYSGDPLKPGRPKLNPDVPPKKYVYDPHICSLCGMTYKNPLGLENHMSRAHGAPKRYNCTVEGCDFGTNVKDPFLDHLYSSHKINVGAKPVLKCTYCDWTTTRKHSFKKHILTHTVTEHKYACNVEGCGKAFRQPRHLRVHKANCHSNQVFCCSFCSAIFNSNMKLRAHIRIMHTHRVRNYKCAYCDHATVQRTNCRTHVKSVHRGLPVRVINLEELGIEPKPEPPTPARGLVLSRDAFVETPFQNTVL